MPELNSASDVKSEASVGLYSHLVPVDMSTLGTVAEFSDGMGSRCISNEPGKKRRVWAEYRDRPRPEGDNEGHERLLAAYEPLDGPPPSGLWDIACFEAKPKA